MALIDVQNITKAGAALTYTAAAAGGDTFQNGGNIIVHAINAHASTARTLTITTVSTPLSTAESEDLIVANIAITLPSYAASSQLGSIFRVPESHTGSGGIVTMTYDDESDVTIAIARIPNK